MLKRINMPMVLAFTGVACFLIGFLLLNQGCSQYVNAPQLFGMDCGASFPGHYLSAAYQLGVVVCFGLAFAFAITYAVMANQQNSK